MSTDKNVKKSFADINNSSELSVVVGYLFSNNQTFH